MSAAAGAVPVLLAAGSASWESAAIDLLARRHTGLALHKRCVDLTDLVGSAATGLARAALVDADLPGLDADAVSVLARSGVGVAAQALAWRRLSASSWSATPPATMTRAATGCSGSARATS